MSRSTRLRRRLSPVLTLALAASLLTAMPAAAVQEPHSAVVSPDPADWTPQIEDGQVNAVLQVGTKVIVGGTFTTVRRAGTSAFLTRNYLFAFDMHTGVIDPNFVPVLDRSVEALTLAPDGTSVFVGGDFSTVNGASYKKLVRLRIADGSVVTPFKANAGALVQDLAFRNGWLYVSGKFTTIKSTARSGMARLDPTTGNVDANFNLPFTNPLRGTLGIQEFDVSADGTKLVAVGNFSKVAGLDRIQIAVLDVGVTPAAVSNWQTSDYPVYVPNSTTTWCSSSFSTYMRDVDIDPTGTYFAVVTTGAFRANRLCDTAARWELGATGPNQHPTWVDWSGGDTSWSVSVTGTAVYVGGHFRWWNNPYSGDSAGPGAVAREGIVALDPINGLPFSWNPGHDRGVGIFAMPATAEGLWAGSDTDFAGGEFHMKLKFFPVDGGVAPLPSITYSLPNDLYNIDLASGALTRRSYDMSTFGVASTLPGVNLASARGAFLVNDLLYTGWSDGTLTVRTFDGTNLGPQSTVNINGLQVQPSSAFLDPRHHHAGSHLQHGPGGDDRDVLRQRARLLHRQSSGHGYHQRREQQQALLPLLHAGEPGGRREPLRGEQQPGRHHDPLDRRPWDGSREREAPLRHERQPALARGLVERTARGHTGPDRRPRRRRHELGVARDVRLPANR